jgi:hypothetical protein
MQASQWTYSSAQLSALRPDLALLRGRQRWLESRAARAGNSARPTSAKVYAFVPPTSGSRLPSGVTCALIPFPTRSRLSGSK